MASTEQKNREEFFSNLIASQTAHEESMIGMMKPVFVSTNEADDSLTVLFNTKAWMRNPVGILHGGVTAAMLDNAMGMLAKYYTDDKSFAPTVNMTVDYIKQIPINDAVVIKACVISKGSVLIRTRAEAKLSGKSGAVASAVATYFVNGF